MGLSISVSPIALFIILIVFFNCLISFGKSKWMNLCYIILSSILSFIGIAGMILMRPIFISRINKSAKIREFDSEFLTWAIKKFDSYAVFSITATCIIILFFLIYFIILKKRDGFLWNNTTFILILIMITNIFIGIVYSIGTINKMFDVAGYISQLIIAEIFALSIPLVTKRILILKNKQCLW
ncbi:hypothetical protein [Lachnoclostridium sp.]|uniref:hypothetical protein n=1 Tax=Lachnoclostridium sp. TaxID=2028282 RepID=UPI00289913F3|nr:hypothetical protein [Lachnoclostridium sp.]